MRRDKHCTCQVCKKKFEYGDEQSPMLSDKVWNQVINFYDLEEYEREAEERFEKNYDSRRRHRQISQEQFDSEHLFLCYECMEKALGRKIEPSDLIGHDVPLNVKFEKMYFKEKEDLC